MIPLEVRRRIMLTGAELKEYRQKEKVRKFLLDCDHLDHHDVKTLPDSDERSWSQS